MKPKEDYYINSKGQWVFTAEYLKKRGFCCGSKCLHCPFNHENVPGKTDILKGNGK